MDNIFPLVTPELVARAEACCIAFSKEKLGALGDLPGNPYGVQVCRFGGATALLAQGEDKDVLFNHVGNISEADLPYLDSIIHWYQAYGTNCSFDITPSNARPELLRYLASQNFYQSDFYTVLYGQPQVNVQSIPDVIVRPAPFSQRESFAEIYPIGFGTPKGQAYSFLRDSILFLVEKPAARCFFALVNGTIAAIALLYLHRNTGYLALAVTLPAFRGCGCQRALLQARIARAAEEGCDLVVGQTEFASVSQHNMEKMGLRIAYTKALWTAYNQ